MRRLVKKTLVYLLLTVLLLFAASVVIYSIRSKDSFLYYEDEAIIQKVDYYRSHNDQYNCLVVGSSRLYRQVNPTLLDERLEAYRLTTFNASTANLRPFRSLDYLDYLEISDSVKYLILELMPPTRIGKNYNTNPTIHSVDLNKYGVLLGMCMSSNYRKDVKAYYLMSYSQAVFYKYFGFGLRKYLSVLMGAENYTVATPFYNIEANDGFMPFELELSMHENKELDRRRKYFTDNSERLISDYVKSSLSDQRDDILPQKDSFVNYLNEKTDSLKSKGVKLFFVISPRKRPWDMKYLLSIKPSLKAPVIDLSSAKDYPEFFNNEYSFDDTHLNKTGAELFTNALAEEMMEVM